MNNFPVLIFFPSYSERTSLQLALFGYQKLVDVFFHFELPHRTITDRRVKMALGGLQNRVCMEKLLSAILAVLVEFFIWQKIAKWRSAIVPRDVKSLDML